jgi:hypothetical protein
MAEEETFKVTDRRGRAKDEAPAAPGEAPPPTAARRAAEAAPASGPDATVQREPVRGTAAKPDLQGVFVMFATSALIHLGEASDPGSGERHVDLDAAREVIDVLLLLRDKTAGNRTDQESRFLEQVLYDLQMRFVQATGRARPAS